MADFTTGSHMYLGKKANSEQRQNWVLGMEFPLGMEYSEDVTLSKTIVGKARFLSLKIARTGLRLGQECHEPSILGMRADHRCHQLVLLRREAPCSFSEQNTLVSSVPVWNSGHDSGCSRSNEHAWSSEHIAWALTP